MNHRIRRTRFARALAMGACLLLMSMAGANAQAPDGTAGPGPGASPGPREAIIGGAPAPAQTFERCVEVEIGRDRSLGCINQQLRREVDKVNPPLNVPPIDARSPDVRVGNVNEAAVRQQYGSNYGRSVVPFRPPTPVFAVPHR